MDGVCKELDEVKEELKRFKEECRTKSELCESLRKVHNEQLIKFQEAKLQIEKRAGEINAKSQEISNTRQKNEDLQSSLREKESFLRHLSSANEKLRVDYGEKIQILEGENRELVLALDDATARTQDLDSKISSANEEIEGLKRLLSVSQKKCVEAQQKAQASKELEQRDDMLLKLEEENSSFQDRLKWRNEQFKHLEDAHERLQDQFQSSKVEWESKKSMLLEEICSLHSSLDSQTRISESLTMRLKMCNQALAHEESRRKFLEVEVSEYRSRLEDVFLEFEEAKLKIESMTLEKDNDIAKLRNSLGTKDMLFKEMEYRNSNLQQENQELRECLKEFREAQITNAGATSSSKKLQKKLQGLEQLFKEKEAEWNSQLKKLTRDLNMFISELKGKDKNIQELQMELEGCHCSLEVQNEEISLIIMVLKSEFSAACSKLSNVIAELQLCNKANEEILLVTEQLQIKDSASKKIYVDLEQEGEQVSSLIEEDESFNLKKEQKIFVEEELAWHKKMLDESSESQLCLKEKVLQMENSLKEENRNFSDALGEVNSELAKKIQQVNQTELELQKWKSIAENLEESQKVLKQEKENLLGIVKEMDKTIFEFQQKIVSLELLVASKFDEVEAFRQEKENYLLIAHDKDSSIENLQKEKEEAKNLKKIEIEEKNRTIAELEKTANESLQKLIYLEEQLSHSEQQAEQLEALLEADRFEKEKLKDYSGTEQRRLEGQVKELKKKLSLEREDLLLQLDGICDQFSQFSREGVELKGSLAKILQNCEKNESARNLIGSGKLHNSASEIVVYTTLSPSSKGIEDSIESIDKRSPLKEFNRLEL
ncbi:uncharacterized protein At4g38062-like [Cornus florida]|uniref:uncharacterized protein At4g38062-like n=1 Tax=Cornus florida TaxID=4283 RepID=UPI00289B1BEC|nr:uncharacterized protein At4g38062-like [Cornus florida]